MFNFRLFDFRIKYVCSRSLQLINICHLLGRRIFLTENGCTIKSSDITGLEAVSACVNRNKEKNTLSLTVRAGKWEGESDMGVGVRENYLN